MDPFLEMFSSPPSSPSYDSYALYHDLPSTGEDRLSDLPEPLLHQIFSTLPTNQVHQTCTLSRKWVHFSASLPNVYFDVDDYEEDLGLYDDDEENYSRRPTWDEDLKELRFCCTSLYVNKYMNNRSLSGVDLEGFRLRWYARVDCSPVKDWIVKAVARNVRQLDIYLGADRGMFTIPAVRCLAPLLQSGRLTLNLKILELIRIKLPKGDSDGELVFRCPILETLILKNCYCKHLRILNLSLNQLKKLEIDNSGNNQRPYDEDDLQGPYDRLGDCKLVLRTRMYVTVHPPLVIASPRRILHLDLFSKVKNSNSLKLLKGLTSAKTLAIGELEIYFEAPEILKELLTSYVNLKKLELKVSLVNYSTLSWVVSFVCQCSSIETLVLHTVQKKEEPVLTFRPLNHLKYAAIWGLEGDIVELEFLRSLLKNALNLERLDVTVDESENYKMKKGDRLKFHTELMELSQQFPNVKVSFKSYKSYKSMFAPLSFICFRPKLRL
ncbi:hypothetical protein Sjap_005529 [Stephania japonica]|uniref:F-box domain-containing protein n=1 Tax=Stephania japonica TaxID=461633 RepID=A0AAP0K4F0_9MAGN